MQNVVSLRSDRPRPQRALGVPRSGARILFFTGVRYCRDEDPDGAEGPDAAEDARRGHRGGAAPRALDATAH